MISEKVKQAVVELQMVVIIQNTSNNKECVAVKPSNEMTRKKKSDRTTRLLVVILTLFLISELPQVRYLYFFISLQYVYI